jgi:hypothetical protein
LGEICQGIISDGAHIEDYTGDDGVVSVEEVTTRLAFALLCTCGNDEEVALARFCGYSISRTNCSGATEKGGIGEVLDLGLETWNIGVRQVGSERLYGKESSRQWRAQTTPECDY